ncbi:cytoplasmic RNA-binding protein [Globomyces sp. JEL0801]|nr:cytoplasmic RNA-binding protein [Globomyces sp. JEL0801]
MEAMAKRFEEMEQEAAKLKEMQAQVEQQLNATTDLNKEETDARSAYIGNVDYTATPEDLQAHFSSCGTINRVTILCDKFTGHPKGFAYIEFADVASVKNSLALNESMFKGRVLAVSAKRTNIPRFQRGRGGYRGSRGAGFRGRGRGAYRYM